MKGGSRGVYIIGATSWRHEERGSTMPSSWILLRMLKMLEVKVGIWSFVCESLPKNETQVATEVKNTTIFLALTNLTKKYCESLTNLQFISSQFSISRV